MTSKKMTTAEDHGGITTERRGAVFLIGLDRPAKRNALTAKMTDELAMAYDEYHRDPELRCALLFGHGQAFCGGADLTTLKDTIDAARPSTDEEFDPFQVNGKRFTKPLVSAIHGICFAGGMELALAGDIILAAEGTILGQPETARGIFAFGGGAVRWVQRVGWGNAQRYLLTGDSISADEAFRIGLIQEVVSADDLTERALEIATKVADAAPLGVQATLEVGRVSLTDGENQAFAETQRLQATVVTTEDAAEGVQSFLERRAGNYKGR